MLNETQLIYYKKNRYHVINRESSRKIRSFYKKKGNKKKPERAEEYNILIKIKHITPRQRSHLIVSRQQADHGSQLRFQLENLTVQIANLRKDRIILLPVIQHHVVVLQSPHLGLVTLNTTFQIQLAVLQLHLLQQELCALLVRMLPPPPITNQRKISNL